MKFLKNLITSAIGIFVVKKAIEMYEKKSHQKKFSGWLHSALQKALPYIKNYLSKK